LEVLFFLVRNNIFMSYLKKKEMIIDKKRKERKIKE